MELLHVASHVDWKVEEDTDNSNDPLQMDTKTEDNRLAKLQNMLSHQKDTAKKILDWENKGVAIKEDIGWHADSKDFGVHKRSEEAAESATTQEAKGCTEDEKRRD